MKFASVSSVNYIIKIKHILILLRRMKAKYIFENKYIHIAVLTIIAVLLYSISCHYEMYPFFDDGQYILHNEHLGFNFQNIMRWLKQPCTTSFLPVTMFSFMFDYNLWGLDSFGYHLQNIFWFVITIIAIYACFIKLKLKPWHAFVLVLIYAVHPQRVESVVWITERKDVLSGAFFFIALFFFINRFEKDKFNFITFFFYILAIFSKPMAISLPVVLVMIDFSRKRHFSPVYYSKKYWPYVLVVIAYMIIIINVKHNSLRAQPDYTRMFSVILFNIYWFTKNAFVPNSYNAISTFYPKIIFGWQAIAQILLFYSVIIGGGIVVFLKTKKETILYCILPLVLCYFAVLSPVLGCFSFSSFDYADRYNYIPSVFLLVSVGYIAPLIINHRSRRMITLLLMIYIMFLTYSTIKYLPCWKNNITLFTKSCNRQPANIFAVQSLGLLEAKAGNYQKAMILVKRLREDYLNDSFKMPVSGIPDASFICL